MTEGVRCGAINKLCALIESKYDHVLALDLTRGFICMHGEINMQNEAIFCSLDPREVFS